jgi:hypothetical protein
VSGERIIESKLLSIATVPVKNQADMTWDGVSLDFVKKPTLVEPVNQIKGIQLTHPYKFKANS